MYCNVYNVRNELKVLTKYSSAQKLLVLHIFWDIYQWKGAVKLWKIAEDWIKKTLKQGPDFEYKQPKLMKGVRIKLEGLNV